jgi:exosome complex component RRP41
MGGHTPEGMKLIDESGKRLDGRRPDELRPIRMEAGVLKRADGSAYVEWGDNKILAAVYGPRELHPRHLQESDKGIVQCRYNMAPFSVDDRKRPGPDRRSQEISKIIGEAFEHMVFVEQFPRTTVDVFIEVLQASAGTRVAGLTAASVALADAGVPMRDFLVGCSAGKVADTVVLDLGKEEDNFGSADVPMAIAPRTGEFLLLQMDGHLTREEFRKAIAYGRDACQRIHEMQKDALRRRYQQSITPPEEAPAAQSAGPQGGEA